MGVNRGVLGLLAICAIIVLFAVGGLVFTFATRLEFNIDGLLLLLVCLMMGGIFSLMLLLLAKDAGWLARLPLPRKKPAAQAAAAANPAKPPPAGQGK